MRPDTAAGRIIVGRFPLLLCQLQPQQHRLPPQPIAAHVTVFVSTIPFVWTGRWSHFCPSCFVPRGICALLRSLRSREARRAYALFFRERCSRTLLCVAGPLVVLFSGLFARTRKRPWSLPPAMAHFAAFVFVLFSIVLHGGELTFTMEGAPTHAQKILGFHFLWSVRRASNVI